MFFNILQWDFVIFVLVEEIFVFKPLFGVWVFVFVFIFTGNKILLIGWCLRKHVFFIFTGNDILLIRGWCLRKRAPTQTNGKKLERSFINFFPVLFVLALLGLLIKPLFPLFCLLTKRKPNQPLPYSLARTGRLAFQVAFYWKKKC